MLIIDADVSGVFPLLSLLSPLLHFGSSSYGIQSLPIKYMGTTLFKSRITCTVHGG